MNEHLRQRLPTGTTMAAEGMPRRAWTVAEIEAMVGEGIIDRDERFEFGPDETIVAMRAPSVSMNLSGLGLRPV
jgi:hypothetical protein